VRRFHISLVFRARVRTTAVEIIPERGRKKKKKKKNRTPPVEIEVAVEIEAICILSRNRGGFLRS